MTTGQMQKSDATQCKIVQKIIDWQHFDDETWEITSRRMKERLQANLEPQPGTVVCIFVGWARLSHTFGVLPVLPASGCP